MKEPVLAAWTLIASAVVLSCSGSPAGGSGQSVQQAYNGGLAPAVIQMQDASSPLSQKKRIPVITAPEIFGVYVPSHVDPERDMLVGEHWLFVKLRDSQWFSSSKKEADGPQVDGDTDFKAENLERLFAPAIHSLGQVGVRVDSGK